MLGPPPLVGTYSMPHRAAGKFSGSASPEPGADHWRTASRLSPRGASRWPFLSSTLSLGCCCRKGTSSSGVSPRSSCPRRCCGSTPGRSARCSAGELCKSVVAGKPAQRSSKCRQSAVTLHPEPTRVDTTRHEPTTVSIGILGTYRPRSRPAWFFEDPEIQVRIPLGSHITLRTDTTFVECTSGLCHAVATTTLKYRGHTRSSLQSPRADRPRLVEADVVDQEVEAAGVGERLVHEVEPQHVLEVFRPGAPALLEQITKGFRPAASWSGRRRPCDSGRNTARRSRRRSPRRRWVVAALNLTLTLLPETLFAQNETP